MTIEELCQTYNQQHLYKHYQTLPAQAQEIFLQELENINFSQIQQLSKLITAKEQEHSDTIEPPLLTFATNTSPQTREIGATAIKNGELALLLVAGGQGTRLGHPGPKGTYKISPIKQKTLFQLFAEQILAAQETYKVKIPLYIMTSETNNKQTQAFFTQHKNFGLDELYFFTQQQLPAVDPQGKIIISSPGHIAFSPDGTGSVYNALFTNNIVATLKEKNIKYLSYFQVDNSLANFIDPKFLGEHIKAQAQMSTKVVKKESPEEKVGLVAKRNGKTCLVEYSVMSQAKQELRDGDGELTFRAGNIALHLINTNFLKQANKELPYYLAHKKVPYYNGTEIISPTEPNAYKFERFVFDALPLTTTSVTYEVSREDEFAPVKNATGKDSPASSQALQIAKYKRWLETSGVNVNNLIIVEIAASYATTEQECKSNGTPFIPAGTTEIYLE